MVFLEVVLCTVAIGVGALFCWGLVKEMQAYCAKNYALAELYKAKAERERKWMEVIE